MPGNAKPSSTRCTVAQALLAWLAGAVLLAGGTAAGGAEQAPPEASYLKLHPDFVVNLRSDGGPHFLLASIHVMSRDAAVIEHAKQHLPAIRHELLMLLSEQSYGDVARVEMREVLREQALAAVNAVLGREAPAAALEALFFNDFVLE